MKAKIEKLLAKAASTDSPAEAEALTEAAERLMVKWGIDRADLEASGVQKPQEVVQKKLDFYGIYAQTWCTFSGQIAYGLGDLQPLKTRWGSNHYTFHIIGHRSDVEVFELILASLTMQATTALQRYREDDFEYYSTTGSRDRFKLSRAFLLGFSVRVSARLQASRAKAEADVSTGGALVLASKKQRVDAVVNQIATGKDNTRADLSGSHAGAAAGERASLGGRALGSSRHAIGAN